jgi:hypothetical protein
MTTTLQTVYERQRELELAREREYDARNRAYDSHTGLGVTWADTLKDPDVKDARAEAERLAVEVTALREAVGGAVFRVVDTKLDELATRIEKLNKKAAKLGTEPIALTVSNEHDQHVFKEDGVERIVDYTFVTVNGETPMIAGWVFVATLDHDADEGADMGVGIRRAPVGTRLKDRIGEEAALAVESADLTDYRQARPDCVHCGWKRRRNQTYVLFEVATGELRQVGTTCVADYTGAHNPERIAAWAEWLEALYSDLGDGDYSEVGGGGGRIAMRTLDFLANVAAVTREKGWVSRWRKDGYGNFDRNYDATADVAESNYFERKEKNRIPVTDEDREAAATALEWVREDLAERDELDEFQHNLATYTRSDWVPAKGSGFVAYTIEARKREMGDRLEFERKERVAVDSEWIGELKQRLKGLVFTVTFTKTIEGHYGTKQLTKGHDADGNLLIWWASGGTWLDQGHTYELTATVKSHDRDSYQNDAKVTEITRVHGPSVQDITVCEDCGEQLRPDPERAGSRKNEICACTIKAREEADAARAAEKAAFEAEHADLRAIYDRVRSNPDSTWRHLQFESFVQTAESSPELIEALVESLDAKELATTTEETR